MNESNDSNLCCCCFAKKEERKNKDSKHSKHTTILLCSYTNHTYFVIRVNVHLWGVEITNIIHIFNYECDEY